MLPQDLARAPGGRGAAVPAAVGRSVPCLPGRADRPGPLLRRPRRGLRRAAAPLDGARRRDGPRHRGRPRVLRRRLHGRRGALCRCGAGCRRAHRPRRRRGKHGPRRPASTFLSPTAASTSPSRATCSSTSPTRGGWPRRCCGSPAPAASSSCPGPRGSLRGVATRRPRGTTSAGVGPPTATRVGTATAPRTTWGGRCSRAPWAGWCAGPQEVERSGRAEVLDVFPRYHPWWAHVGHRGVPGLREVVSWNAVIVLRVGGE